ncbi:MAG: carboxypeptidase-like regulatory domain-containing protein [Bacteroidetes bacterium]|nr:carboxypeptidase-like regulatory domain-containing protein [Bacteroidota bacterium]
MRFLFIGLFFLLLALMGSNAFSQDTIRGKVVNTETLAPVENAHIVVKGGKGAVSKKDGRFEIIVFSLPVVLEISHVSFQPKEQKVGVLENASEIVIMLEPQVTMLSGVSITAGEAHNLAGGNKILVLDYEFLDGQLLLLCRNLGSGKYLLKLTQPDGTFISEKELDKKPEKLFRDCEAKVYLMFKDIIYSLSIYKENIKFSGVYSQEDMVAITRCIIEFENRYYFSVYAGNNKTMAYYYISEEVGQPVKVKVIKDEFKHKMWKDEERFASMGAKEFTEFDAEFAKLAIYTPVYAPLIKLLNSYCIFDFVNSRIEHFSTDNKSIKEVPIYFHQQKGWKKQIYFDEKQGRVFQLYELNGISSLKEVNPHNGELLNNHSLKGFNFAENIKIYDGSIYFIARNSEHNDLRQVYRVGF